MKYIYALLLFIGLSSSAFGELKGVKGEYLCKLIFKDGSKYDRILRITNNKMTALEPGHRIKQHYKEIYSWIPQTSFKVPPARAFIQVEPVYSSGLGELLLTLSVSIYFPEEVHYIELDIGRHVKTTEGRIHSTGLCKSI